MTTATIAASATASGTALLTIDVTSPGVGETMTLRRRAGSQLLPVMGAAGIPAADRVLVDPEVPLNVATSWQLTFSGGLVIESDPLTIVAELGTLADPVRGIVADVAVIDRDQLSRTNRATLLQVERDPTLHVVWDVPVGQTMPLSLLTLTVEARDAVSRALETGDPLLLRCVCGLHADVWIQPTDDKTTAELLTPRAAAVSRRWLLGEVIVYTTNPRIGVVARWTTLGDIDAAVDPHTLGEIAARWGTLGQIATADL